MLEESVVEVCCREVLWRSVGEESWGRLLEKSFGEVCVVEKCWERVLLEKCVWRSVGEKCCREMM